ncbi:NepR family anti-sigma factor [Maricaulaceae bacterium MS644]
MNKKSDKSQPKLQDTAAARERQRLIGRRLQTYFEDTIQEGVPDEFARLLDQLDEAEKRGPEPSGGDSEANSGKPGGSR